MFRQLFEYIKTIIYGTQYKNEDYAQDSELQYHPPFPFLFLYIHI